MYQISYASKSTLTKEQLLVELRNILSESIDFNFFNNITGVLYFSDGYFFQYLEGTKESLEILIGKLKKDPRHTDLKFFEMQKLDKRYLDNWSMKYVAKTSHIQEYLNQCQISHFDPHELSQQQADDLVHILVSQENCKL